MKMIQILILKIEELLARLGSMRSPRDLHSIDDDTFTENLKYTILKLNLIF